MIYTVVAKTGNKAGTEVGSFSNMYDACSKRDELNDKARQDGTFNDRWFIVTVSRVKVGA